jgi:hypothetical protein
LGFGVANASEMQTLSRFLKHIIVGRERKIDCNDKAWWWWMQRDANVRRIR